MKNHLNEIKFKNFTWVHSSSIDEKTVKEIGKRFNLRGEDTKDVPPPNRSPKLVARPDYVFLTFLYPFYDKNTGEISASEVDFFVAEKFVITFNEKNRLKPIEELVELCDKDKKLCEKMISDGPVALLYELLDRLSNHCFPMLVHISNDIDAVEKRLFKEYEKGKIYEILRIKTNIANFSKAIQGHKTITEKLINTAPPYLPINRLQIYFQNLVERKKEMWDLVFNYIHIIDALHQTNESLISFRINEIMKTLTIFSVIVFPLTLVASIFGMNAVKGMPFLESANGFWIVIGIMAIGTLTMLGIFKGKKWI